MVPGPSGGQRTTLWEHFSLSVLMRFPGLLISFLNCSMLRDVHSERNEGR